MSHHPMSAARAAAAVQRSQARLAEPEAARFDRLPVGAIVVAQFDSGTVRYTKAGPRRWVYLDRREYVRVTACPPFLAMPLLTTTPAMETTR